MQSIEIEVKFRVRDLKALEANLPRLGFHCETPRTFERNILFDTTGARAPQHPPDSALAPLRRPLGPDPQADHAQ